MVDETKPIVLQDIDDSNVDEGWNDDVVPDLIAQDYSKVA